MKILPVSFVRAARWSGGMLVGALLAAAPFTPVSARPAAAGPPAIDARDVEQAAIKFASLYDGGGMIAAQTFSAKCRRAALRTRSWSRRDLCAAFDYAASMFDAAMAERGGFPTDQYFTPLIPREAELYRGVSTDAALIERRVQEIKAAVGPPLWAALAASQPE
jgi:hypothetical protein